MLSECIYCEVYKKITICVNKPNPTQPTKTGKFSTQPNPTQPNPTQPNPTHGWIQPTSMSVLNKEYIPLLFSYLTFWLSVLCGLLTIKYMYRVCMCVYVYSARNKLRKSWNFVWCSYDMFVVYSQLSGHWSPLIFFPHDTIHTRPIPSCGVCPSVYLSFNFMSCIEMSKQLKGRP